MEQKLAEFRARKKASSPPKMEQCVSPEPLSTTTAAQCTHEQAVETPQNKLSSSSNTSPKQDKSDWLLDCAVGRWFSSRLAFTNLTLLKVLLWLVLLGLFVELEFGLPFFLISLFYWLYEGLRSPEARQPGELSAYSVFNPDCQPLLGSLTAEQLEGEMGYRPLANR